MEEHVSFLEWVLVGCPWSSFPSDLGGSQGDIWEATYVGIILPCNGAAIP